MTFIEPGGRTSVMQASPLPAPLHTAPSFCEFPFLSAQKTSWSISRAIAALTLTPQPDTGRSFQRWLQHTARRKRHRAFLEADPGQRPERRPRPDFHLLRGASRSRVDEVAGSAPHGRSHHPAHRPLQSRRRLHSQPAAAKFTSAIRSKLSRRRRRRCRFAVPREERAEEERLRLPRPRAALRRHLDRVLPQTPEAAPLREQLPTSRPRPITGIHLWFDRQITDLDHAVLLDRTIQWMFHKSRLAETDRDGRAANARNPPGQLHRTRRQLFEEPNRQITR